MYAVSPDRQHICRNVRERETSIVWAQIKINSKEQLFEYKDNIKVKLKLSRYRSEQAHGRSGRLRPRIFLTFGTRRW
jgi:hypothetical protein